MNIKIMRLMLQNFKGIKSLEIDAGGESLSIYGDNATGKTTVFDAFMWLLFGKDSLGRSDFGIKTQDENGNVLHNLEHSVECEMSVDDTVLTLKKVYAEKWTKKRGSAEAEFSGHETKYFVNEVPTTKKEYEQKISGIIDETLFKIITNPLYFNESMKWQERRAILLKLCGNITDEDIISNNAEFSPLLDELKGRTIQEYKKIIQSKQTAINDELKVIPQRISEANLAIPEIVEKVDEADRAIHESKIEDLKNQIIATKNGAGVNAIDEQIKKLEAEKKELENKKCDTGDLEQELQKFKAKIAEAQSGVDRCKRGIDSAEYIIQEHERKADELRKMWYEVNEKQYSEDGICPICGQALPEEQIAAAKANFNTERAEKLETITEQGKKAKAVSEQHLKERQNLIMVMNDLQISIDEYTLEIERGEKLIAQIKTDFEEKRKADILAIDKRIAEATETAQNGTESISNILTTLNAEIATERAKIAEIDKYISTLEFIKRQKDRITQLEADEKRLATEYASLEKTAFLIDKFIKYKVDLLSAEINSHFRHAKFKLFDEQINGGIAECCEVTYRGVPYSDLNNASRINIGLDVINTICKVNDKTAPIIIDNAESVTNILPTASQMICLVVSANDNMLRVEKGI